MMRLADSVSNSDTTMNSPESSLYAGAFFPRARHFVITGGNFTSNVTHNVPHAAQTVADVRKISWGDIDLRRELRFNRASSIVTRHPLRAPVRRMYSAKIQGTENDMAVAVYEGGDAEEHWRHDIAKYSCLRHPNVLQIFGTASSPGIYAIVAHGDLIHYRDYLKLYNHLPIFSVYICGHADMDYYEAFRYLRTTFQESPSDDNVTFWIRRSTGQGCVELARRESNILPEIFIGMDLDFESTLESGLSLDDAAKNARGIGSLDLFQYHELCYWHQSQAVTTNFLKDGEWAEIASVTGLDFYCDLSHSAAGLGVGELVQNGWTRYKACDVFGTTVSYRLGIRRGHSWLSQANHIFARRHITSNYEKYAMVTAITFEFKMPPPQTSAPAGYLFVHPMERFQIGPHSFRWPAFPAWSLDRSGASILSTEEATHMGFPRMELIAAVRTRSYDASVYAGLRKFHEAKGFDAESQDVARHLGVPLYQIPGRKEGSFAHRARRRF
ncbi:hypothetical protein B0H14DRAFT_2696136 [Mycena olivaceomarginata]|nr:hypothetical protein B0H14DRAFT_2696136 [Mycena olivaceomarginata]